MRGTDPVSRQLVLAGGGHTHALVLRRLGMQPLRGVGVTLVSDVSRAAYSGMLPGAVAGRYRDDEIYIDLRRLCDYAGATFVHASICGLDLARRQVLLTGRPPVAYDLLSLNVGGTPGWAGVPGAAALATPAKPVDGFLAAWRRVKAAAAAGSAGGARPRAVVLVGGGAGGVEVALGMARCLGAGGRVTLVEAAPRLLPAHGVRASAVLTRAAQALGIEVCLGAGVARVEPGKLTLASGRQLPFDELFWVTGATPAPWLRASGLAVDAHGFVQVGPTLQSASHAGVFAAGDVATVVGAPRPRSGVYAVRQAAPLTRNLRRWLAGRPLRPTAPQRQALSLIGTGAGEAVASRGALVAHGRAWWWVKERIDRRFMRRFAELGPMPRGDAGQAAAPLAPLAAAASGPSRDAPSLAAASGPNWDEAGLAAARTRAALRCGGCAAKVGGGVLGAALDRVRQDLAAAGVDLHAGGSVLVGLAERGDAAALSVAAGRVLVQSVDFLPALVRDPYVFGQIAAAHAFSDIFAMGAEPHSAQVLVNVPYAAPGPTAELVYQLLSGVLRCLTGMGAVLVGGHTTEASELALGVVANATAPPGGLWRKDGLAPGQALVLTKAVGTGTLFVAAMHLAAEARWLDAATQSMLQTNQAAASVLRRYAVAACTDVTGFGLLGHLADLVRGAAVRVELELDAVPCLPGAVATAQRGLLSTLQAMNAAQPEVSATPAARRAAAFPLLSDPQTSGGLLAAVPAAQAAACAAALRAAGYPDAAIVGRVTAGEDPCIHVF